MQTRHLLALVLLSALCSACGEHEAGIARAAERPASLCEHPTLGPLTPGTRLLLPLTSRSEVVPLAPMAGTTLALELPGAQGGQLRLTTLRHGDSEQVLETESGLVIVGPPTLAHRVDGAEPTRLARQDSHAAVGAMTLHAPAGDWGALVLIPTHAGTLRTGRRELAVGRGTRAAAVVLAPAPVTALEATVPVDHAFYTERVRPARLPRLGSWRAARFERGALRVDLSDEPALEDGETLTLVLEVVEPPRVGAVAREAAAPGPAGRRPWLTDVTRAAGIEVVHLEGPDLQLDIRPTMGPGAAWGDFNGDGHPDLFLVQGAGRPEQEPLPHRLYLGDGAGGFRDATEGAGLGAGDAGMGALALDVEGDGDLDLYLANRGRDRLLLGRGDGTFEEASALLPDLELWSASACAADYDGDGDLDLYVTSYLEYDPSLMPPEDAARWRCCRTSSPDSATSCCATTWRAASWPSRRSPWSSGSTTRRPAWSARPRRTPRGWACRRCGGTSTAMATRTSTSPTT